MVMAVGMAVGMGGDGRGDGRGDGHHWSLCSDHRQNNHPGVASG